MAENNKIYITANELAEMLGVSVGHAYKLIRKLNQELEKEVLTYLSTSSLLKEDTLIVVEASLATAFDYLDELGFRMQKLKTYKTNEHAFICKK